MKLDDFLKCKKARCVKAYEDCLKIGKEYSVLDIRMEVKVKDDEGDNCYWESDHFEPVVDGELPKSAEKPLQDIELTPEFEVVEPVLADNSVNTQDNSVNIQDTPKFKVEDKVYLGLSGKIEVIKNFTTINSREYIDVKSGKLCDSKICCHATQENYERLQATFPDIEFEQPPKELKGSDLCFEKLRNGKKLVMCAVSDLSDEKAIKRLQDGDNCIRVIKDCDPAPYDFIDTHGIRHGFAVPLNDETGEPLTEGGTR